MIHIDVKKLGRIASPGIASWASSYHRKADRLAYAEVLTDEKGRDRDRIPAPRLPAVRSAHPA